MLPGLFKRWSQTIDTSTITTVRQVRDQVVHAVVAMLEADRRHGMSRLNCVRLLTFPYLEEFHPVGWVSAGVQEAGIATLDRQSTPLMEAFLASSLGITGTWLTDECSNGRRTPDGLSLQRRLVGTSHEEWSGGVDRDWSRDRPRGTLGILEPDNFRIHRHGQVRLVSMQDVVADPAWFMVYMTRPINKYLRVQETVLLNGG